MTSPPGPSDREIQEVFTRQAPTYATSLLARDPSLPAMLELAEPTGGELMLDLAAGTGMVSFAFAAYVHRVIAIDLTPAMLAQAASRQQQERTANLSLLVARAQALPFADDRFDLATCRIAIHHFRDPLPILAELRRVLRPDGRVVISDAVASEDPARAARHNAIERLRDSSHVRMLPESELRDAIAWAGFHILAARSTSKDREVDEWMALGQTPPAQAEQVRALMREAIPDDAAGIQARLVDGELNFTHHTVTVVAEPE